uniref:Uncharacterized protein n=1 Tax=Rhizophora mucronata TaxID=61149 RepID=A0A2P2QY85_RHIMU
MEYGGEGLILYTLSYFWDLTIPFSVLTLLMYQLGCIVLFHGY